MALTGSTVLTLGGGLLVALPAPAGAAPVVGFDRLYTTGADFAAGVARHLDNAAPETDRLRLSRVSARAAHITLAASTRGTVIRLDAETGRILGEWRSAPDGRGRNPARTAVDRLGNTWVANRDETEGGRGSVTRIGVALGGLRADPDGTPNPEGALLRGPFAHNTCVDRNGDGLIATSRGLGDVRPWTNAGNADGNGGVSTAADECVITYTRVAGAGTRTVAVDAQNDLWTGGADTEHEKVDGATGQPVPGSLVNLGCGGYGGLVDRSGTLWSARTGNNLLRYEPGTGTGRCLDASAGDLGLAEDPVTGEIWHTRFSGNQVVRLSPDGTVLGAYPHGSDHAEGVAVDRSGNVWVAHSFFLGTTTVGHLRTDGTYVGNVTLPGGQGPTGVSVDANGKVWVTNLSTNNVMRIDPAAGPVGGGGFPVGAVDLTVDLGAGAGPANYSDMTSTVSGESLAPQGTWTVVQDGGAAGQTWGSVRWNTEAAGSVPAGASITVAARAADTEAALAERAFTPVSNGGRFGLVGRFIEVRATLTASPGGHSPVLADLRISGASRTGVFACQATGLRFGAANTAQANPAHAPCTGAGTEVALATPAAGLLRTRVTGLRATTVQAPGTPGVVPPAAGDNAVGTATVQTTRITGLLTVIEIGAVQASATVRCVAGPAGLVAQFSSASSVTGLRINGVPRTVGSQPTTIQTLEGTLRLNQTVTTASGVTRRAVVFDTATTDVVVGEARAGAQALAGQAGGSPCRV